jgi:Putative stress-induced transcription regulator
VSDAALVVALANGQRDRRPTHARVAMSHDALADAASASRLLEPFLGRRIGAKELAAVRALQTAVVAIVDALIDGSPPPLDQLNGLAAKEPTIARLKRQRDGKLQATLQAKHASAVGTLVVAAIASLANSTHHAFVAAPALSARWCFTTPLAPPRSAGMPSGLAACASGNVVTERGNHRHDRHIAHRYIDTSIHRGSP